MGRKKTASPQIGRYKDCRSRLQPCISSSLIIIILWTCFSTASRTRTFSATTRYKKTAGKFALGAFYVTFEAMKLSFPLPRVVLVSVSHFLKCRESSHFPSERAIVPHKDLLIVIWVLPAMIQFLPLGLRRCPCRRSFATEASYPLLTLLLSSHRTALAGPNTGLV